VALADVGQDDNAGLVEKHLDAVVDVIGTAPAEVRSPVDEHAALLLREPQGGIAG